MGSTIFHHWLDQYRALPQRRRRTIDGLGVLLAAGAVFALGAWLGQGIGLPGSGAHRAALLARQNARLAQQVQGLQQQVRTAQAAQATLKQGLASRDTELETLKQQQMFYAKLIGLDGDRSGLGVHDIRFVPVAGTQAWNFVVTLVNTAQDADAARGELHLSVEGIAGGKLVTLGWSHLAGAHASGGVAFAFRFFQQVRGSIMLPKGFKPNRVTVTLVPVGGAPVVRTLDWQGALAGGHGITLTTP